MENTLYIHTSAGSFRYTVEGTGTPNPYRIQVLITSMRIIPKTLQPIKINQFGESFSTFTSAAGRCEAAIELKLLSGHPDPQPSPVDHPGWKHNPQPWRIKPPTSKLFRCWRCTQVEEICTLSCPREVWRRTTACGRSHLTTPSLSCAQPSSPGLRATTPPISGIRLIVTGRLVVRGF